MAITLMGVAEYASARNISQKMLRKLIKGEEIAAGKCHGKWLLDVDAVDEYFKQLTKPRKQERKQFDYLAEIEAMRKGARA